MCLSILRTFDKFKQLDTINNNIEHKILKRTKELQKMQKKLLNQANRDPLTKLYNRRYFNEVLLQLTESTKRESSNLSVLMIDIDNFKNINDTYGHELGDKVIINLASLLIQECRKSDIVVRYGGEEFIILFPNTNIKNAKIISEKLRQTIENEVIEYEDNTIKYTISLGLSIYNFKNIKKTIHKADKALYQSKRSGKNKLCIKA